MQDWREPSGRDSSQTHKTNVMPRKIPPTQHSNHTLSKYFRETAMEPFVVATMSNPNDKYYGA